MSATHNTFPNIPHEISLDARAISEYNKKKNQSTAYKTKLDGP